MVGFSEKMALHVSVGDTVVSFGVCRTVKDRIIERGILSKKTWVGFYFREKRPYRSTIEPVWFEMSQKLLVKRKNSGTS